VILEIVFLVVTLHVIHAMIQGFVLLIGIIEI